MPESVLSSGMRVNVLVCVCVCRMATPSLAPKWLV